MLCQLVRITFIFTENSTNDDNGSMQTKWYMFLITCICGIFVGATSLFVIQRLHRRLRNGSSSNKNSEANGVDDRISIYDDVDVRTRNLPDNSSRSTLAETKRQSIYEELNMKGDRDEDNYESLIESSA